MARTVIRFHLEVKRALWAAKDTIENEEARKETYFRPHVRLTTVKVIINNKKVSKRIWTRIQFHIRRRGAACNCIRTLDTLVR